MPQSRAATLPADRRIAPSRTVLARSVLALLVLACVAATAVGGASFATRTYLDQDAARGQTTLRLAVAALRGHMNRFEPLPGLIADSDDIQDLVARPDDPQLRARGNAYLKDINAQLHSSDIYVMVPDGSTIAASNHDRPGTFVGENFSYRPYFTEAMEGRQGRFFALGTTSLKRGYYFSAPVRIGGEVRGVVVFKVDIEGIESSWRGGDYEIFVSDPEGIIFMTGRQEWLYSSQLPLTRERLERTHASRRYANADLRELPISGIASLGAHRLMEIADRAGRREYLVLDEPMAEAGWTVNVLIDTSSARARAWTTVAAIVLLLGLAGLGAAVLLQRRARLAERMEMQRSAQAELERRVAERTSDLALVNRQLETEVSERRATEQQLRQTQADLIQAGKLAALGQMSAALSHEFNQPLAAVKTYASNALVLIDRSRVSEARDNLLRICGLADRMATLGRHLRNFARKPNEKLGVVSLEEVLTDTLEIVRARLKAADAQISIRLGDHPLFVRAGAVRLQQVMVNIISNAADAAEQIDDRRIDVTATADETRIRIEVRDRGAGVPPAIAERIFDPFFTTKGVGKGLGLGLSISYNIVKDFGGNLSVTNHDEGGAVFSVTLDRAAEPLAEAAE
jgi:two-component system C4-dicarboxylate transport sensor histidine kinase DctB